MEKLQLATGKEYTLAVDGFNIGGDKVRIKIVSTDSVEQIKEIFSNNEATNIMKVINGESTQRVTEGYTERGNSFLVSEDELIDMILTGPEPEEVRGNTIEFFMCKRSLETDVIKNRADIDYLMMMEGEPV